MKPDWLPARPLQWTAVVLLGLTAYTLYETAYNYWTTRWLLQSPIIPQEYLSALEKRQGYTTLIYGATGIIALLLYLYQKYTACIVITILSLVTVRYFSYLWL